MIQHTRPLLLGSIAVVAAFLLSSGFSVINHENSESATSSDGAGLMGHITLIAYDPYGNIKQYVQTDNLVVDQGEACALRAVTGSTSTPTDCGGTSVGSFNVIALGTGTVAANANDIALGAETTDSGLARTAATGNTVTNDPDGITGAKATLTKTFTRGAIGGTTAVAEAGIFNSTGTTSDALLARQQFTAISLGNNDQLAITWDIIFDG